MSNKNCSEGSQWDNLVNACIQSGLVNKVRSGTEPRPEHVTSEVLLVAEVQLRSMAHTPRVDPGLPLSPALWIFVVLATLGSILALVLWFIIYRQRMSANSNPENSKREQEPLQKTDAGSMSHSLPSGGNSHPSLCPFHLRLETQSTLQWVEDISPNRASTKHAESEESSGLPSCSTVREHRIPLPATELGGTALVTTKTV
ncbi:tumor necrosis factor receptor superfamily member 13C-like [Takifugu flavidus]|uniref:Uncharacterized protein n=1 Tax=Takifugu bimaculatus TaxID=433685 RepID=A0A4Z2BWV3_9TELE|nr:tumor necrosis factor receptor superfamily member 13C-like [Takifugu flavidus]TNM96664.1 hypothetical protein fugu_014820 [Takifugu bimaculatus]